MSYKERIVKIHGSFGCQLTTLTVGTPYGSVNISVSLLVISSTRSFLGLKQSRSIDPKRGEQSSESAEILTTSFGVSRIFSFKKSYGKI